MLHNLGQEVQKGLIHPFVRKKNDSQPKFMLFWINVFTQKKEHKKVTSDTHSRILKISWNSP